MQTPSQVLRAKIIRKIEYKEMLEEEIAAMSKKHKAMVNREVNKKYKKINDKERKRGKDIC